MIKDKQIESWLKNGIITEAQAKKMLADLAEYRQETTSNKLITVISTIGALLLGIGAILFIASNWQLIPHAVKLAILFASTFVTYSVGYLFTYRLQNLPRVGEALLFLGTLLFGGTIFVIAQMYHVNANNHTLILLWLLGILPFVYAFTCRAITHLSAFLFFIWIGLFIFQGVGFSKINLMLLPLVYLVSSVLMFNYGSLHSFYSHFALIGPIYRLWGINVGMMSLFFLSFKYFSAHADPTFLGFVLRDQAIQSHFTNLFIGSCVLVIICALILLWKNPSKSRSTYIESCVSIGLIMSAALCFFMLSATNLYVLMFNVLFVLLLMVIIVVGNNNKDMIAINIAMFWAGAFIIARYFDFFWDLLPRSLFFIAGGLVLVIGGIILESKRRSLKLLLSNKIVDTYNGSNSIKKLFVIVAIFWIILISGMVIYKELILRGGTEITLKAAPVDPRDIFRGDYITLNYDISNLDLDTMPSEKSYLSEGDIVFVALENKNGHAQAVRIDTKPLKDTLYLQGKVVFVHGRKISIYYGIENYFVPEHKGKEIERAHDKNFEAKVVVSSSGKAVLKGLLMDNKKIY